MPDEGALRKYYQRIPMDQIASGVHSLPFLSAQSLFGENRPLILDLGCGRAEYSIQQALTHPDLGFVGIDFHEKSLLDACSKAAEQRLENIRFLCVDLRWGLHLFEPQSVAGAYLLFPPPISAGHQKFSNREVLTTKLLALLGNILVPGSRLTLATDVPVAFERWKKLLLAQPQFSLDKTEQLESTTWYQRVWGRHGLPLLMLSVRRRDVEVSPRRYGRPFLVFAPTKGQSDRHRELVECLEAKCSLPVSASLEAAAAAETVLLLSAQVDPGVREVLGAVRRKLVFVWALQAKPLREPSPDGRTELAEERDTLAWADGILVPSESARELIAAVYGPAVVAKVLVVGSPLDEPNREDPADLPSRVQRHLASDATPLSAAQRDSSAPIAFMRQLRHQIAEFAQKDAKRP